MQQFRHRDSFLEGDDDDNLFLEPMGDDEAGNIDENGNDDLFLEEVSDEVAPLLSDAERFWGASAAPEMVVAAVEDFMSEFVEGLLRGQLADIELVREKRNREDERRRRRTKIIQT